MNNLGSHITKGMSEFDALYAQAQKIFKLENAMPDQVFYKPYDKYLFEIGDWLLNIDSFDFTLKPLAVASGDDTLILGIFSDVQNIEGLPYFIKYPITTSSQAYKETLFAGDAWELSIDGDMRLLHNFVWFTPSGLWAIWASNAHGETGVLAFADDDMYHKARHISDSWFTAYEALDGYMKMMFWGGVIPERYSQPLINNYGWLERNRSHKNLPLISNYDEFKPIWDQINTIFYVDKEYSDTIFKKPYSYFLKESFWIVVDHRAWDLMLKRLALLSGDDAIIVATIKPNPIEELYPKQKDFNAVVMPLDTTTHLDYWRTMEAALEKDGEYVGGLVENAETLVWTVKSGKWAIWGGNRAIIGFSDENIFNKAKAILTTWLPL